MLVRDSWLSYFSGRPGNPLSELPYHCDDHGSDIIACANHHVANHPPNTYCQPEVQTEAPGSCLEVLSQVPEDRAGSKAQFKRIELSVVLCEHATAEAAEGRRIS